MVSYGTMARVLCIFELIATIKPLGRVGKGVGQAQKAKKSGLGRGGLGKGGLRRGRSRGAELSWLEGWRPAGEEDGGLREAL